MALQGFLACPLTSGICSFWNLRRRAWRRRRRTRTSKAAHITSITTLTCQAGELAPASAPQNLADSDRDKTSTSQSHSQNLEASSKSQNRSRHKSHPHKACYNGRPEALRRRSWQWPWPLQGLGPRAPRSTSRSRKLFQTDCGQTTSPMVAQSSRKERQTNLGCASILSSSHLPSR